MSSRWNGQRSKKARAICAPIAAAGGPCYRCRKPILPGQAWHADHIVMRDDGGTDGPENLWPSHDRCNERDGGKRGAAITNALKAERRARERAHVAKANTKSTTALERGIRGV